MRPLFFDHADDPEIWRHPLQYQLGDHLLVNPVTEPGRHQWSTYLPNGSWIDVWTGQPANGAQILARSVPVETIPVYCSAAAWPNLRTVFAPMS